MPISIVCSDCSAKLNAPDTAAGKKIKCPKCQAVCSVPAAVAAAPDFEVVDDPEEKPVPAPKTAKPVAKAAVPDDDEDEVQPRTKKKAADGDEERPRTKKKAARENEDEIEDRPRAKKKAADDDEDDRPRKRKGKQEEEDASKSSGKRIGLIAGGVLLVAGIAFGAYWFGFRGKTDSTNPSNVSTENWEIYTSPANVFKASFPGKAEGREWKPPTGNTKVVSDIREFRSGETQAGKPSISYFAGYVRFPDLVRPAEIANAKKLLITLYAAPATYGGPSPSTVGVQSGDLEWEHAEITSGGSTGVVRWYQIGSMLHLVGYRCENQKTPQDAVKKFFAAHEVLGGDPGDPDPDPDAGKPLVWQPYTSPDGMFKVSFPGEPSNGTISYIPNGTAYNFREFTAEKGGKSRTYFVGYIRFAQKPPIGELTGIGSALRDKVTALKTAWQQSGWQSKKIPAGGREWQQWTWPKIGGSYREVRVDNTIFAIGIQNTGPLPSEKEVEQFYNSFEILATEPKTDPKTEVKTPETPQDAPAGWVAFKPGDGGFRSIMPPGKLTSVNVGVMDSQKTVIASARRYSGSEDGVRYTVIVAKFTAGSSEAERQNALGELSKVPIVVPDSTMTPGSTWNPKITWGSRDASEMAYAPVERGVVRQTRTAAAGYIASVNSTKGKLDSLKVKKFFESFEFDKE